MEYRRNAHLSFQGKQTYPRIDFFCVEWNVKPELEIISKHRLSPYDAYCHNGQTLKSVLRVFPFKREISETFFLANLSAQY